MRIERFGSIKSLFIQWWQRRRMRIFNVFFCVAQINSYKAKLWKFIILVATFINAYANFYWIFIRLFNMSWLTLQNCAICVFFRASLYIPAFRSWYQHLIFSFWNYRRMNPVVPTTPLPNNHDLEKVDFLFEDQTPSPLNRIHFLALCE